MDSSSLFSSNDGSVPLSLVVGTGVTTLLLASALAFVLFKTQRNKDSLEGPGSASSSVSTAATEVDREKYPGGSLYLYYATQTGTAESFARQMEREGAKHGFFCHVVDLEDVSEVAELKTPCAILSATYGEGEPTDNATAFVDLLKEAARIPVLFEKEAGAVASSDDDAAATDVEPILKEVEYCVFGLGNRQYDHYNAMGRFFHEALRRLGAKAVVDLGLGDDDADLEGDFETWKDNEFWPTMKKLYVEDVSVLRQSSKSEAEQDKLPDCCFAVEYHDKPIKPNLNLPLEKVHGASRHYYDAVECDVQVVRELRSKEDPGSTVHVEVCCSNHNKLKYITADNLGVLPVNQAKHVESVAKCLNYNLDQCFTVKAAPGQEWHGAPFPMPCTIRDVLTNYCDLTAAPRRSELKLLARYATDKVDKQFLQRLSSKEAAKTEYKEKIVNDYVGLVHLLEKCPSIQIPLEHLVDVCPRLQPRFFTIASSNQVHPKSIHLTVAVAQATRPSDQSLFEGVCSTYLASRQSAPQRRMPFGGGGEKKSEAWTIRAFVRPSSFRLPTDPSKPIVLIGPGTGVAPMRALLQERQHQKQKQKLNVGKNILYFGCKKRSLDYLYREEFEAWEKDGTLDALHTAFSREQDSKVYVQHLLLKHDKETFALIHSEGAYIYVCGGVCMGHDVQEALKSILSIQHEEISNDVQAKEYLDKLATEGRYVQELWA